MSMSRLRWRFTNKSVTGAAYNINSYNVPHSWTLWWKVRWLEHCRFQVATKLQQRRCITDRCWKSIPRTSGSHREGSITQRGAPSGRNDQHRRWSTSKTWTYVGSQVEGLSEVWRRRAVKATMRQNHITGTEFSPGLSDTVVHGEVELHAGSDFLAENIKQVAALKTDCSRCNSCPDIPERTELH